MDTGLNLSSASGSRSNSIPSGSTSPGLDYSYPEDKASSPLHQLACVAEAAAENHGPGLKQQNNHCHNWPAHPLGGYSHLPNLNTAPPLDSFAAELAYQPYLNFPHSNALYGYQDSTHLLPPSTHQLQPFRYHVVPPSLQANNERFFRLQAEVSKSSVYTRPQLPAGAQRRIAPGFNYLVSYLFYGLGWFVSNNMNSVTSIIFYLSDLSIQQLPKLKNEPYMKYLNVTPKIRSVAV